MDSLISYGRWNNLITHCYVLGQLLKNLKSRRNWLCHTFYKSIKIPYSRLILCHLFHTIFIFNAWDWKCAKTQSKNKLCTVHPTALVQVFTINFYFFTVNIVLDRFKMLNKFIIIVFLYNTTLEEFFYCSKQSSSTTLSSG